MERPPADRSSSPALAPPRRSMVVDGSLSRFSPLTAPERAVVEAFCTDTRPWALREAKRSYRHLPSHIREQAVDRAMQELRTSAPASVDRRTLMAGLADALTEALRHLHVGWCLNESTARLRREGVDPQRAPASGVAQDGLAEFVEQGLGGLERAVLQLEIGAGRDSRTTRAALRLGPREYNRHRETGLSKLRDAIGARVAGRVCDQHLTAVVLAATGDRHAARLLSGGSSRCRACAREAQGMRAVLAERLAVAPWPLVVKPAGVLAAKAGALTAIFGGKSAGGIGAVAIGSSGGAGAGAAATVIAAAALVTGATALVEDSPRPQAQPQPQTLVAAAAKTSERAAKRTFAVKANGAGTRATTRRANVKAAAPAKTRTATLKVAKQRTARKPARREAPTSLAAAPTTAAAQSQAASTPAPSQQPNLTNTVGGTVHKVNDTVKQVTKQLPPALAKPVDDTLDGLDQTVNGLTNTLDDLLQPQP